MQVYPRKQMCLYNMFNHYFFDSKGESILLSFLHDGGKGLVLVSDPPFGGMVEPLVATFRKIEQSWQQNVETGVSSANLKKEVFVPFMLSLFLFFEIAKQMHCHKILHYLQHLTL